MRCDQCNKFTSFDSDVDPDVSIDISQGAISGEVRIVNQCADCGQDLKDASFLIDENVDDEIKTHEESKPKGTEHVYEVSFDDASRTDRMENKTRTGKPIRNPRYMKHMYGAEGTIVVRCSCDEAGDPVVSRPWSDEVAGSEMEELI